VKILHLMPFSPVPADFGGALRIFHIARQLSERHEVRVLGYGEPAQADTLRAALPALREVTFLPPPWIGHRRRLGQIYSSFSRHSFFHLSVVARPMQRAIDAALAQETDAVVTEFSHFGPFALKTRALKIVDTHNVEYDTFKRMYETATSPVRKVHYWLEYRKQRRDELAWCAMQDALLATSERDRAIFGKDLPGVPSFVVPNGVDSAYFTPSGQAPEPHALVFTGTMAWVPNYDGIVWFVDEVLPRIVAKVPDVKLYVVGKSPPSSITARASERVIVTGTVADVRPYVDRASVYVVPLRIGGGTRLKIAEAMAMRKPIVTTAIGCEGIDVEDGRSVLLANDPQAFADATVRLLEDSALRDKLVANGHVLMQEKYEWSVIGERLEAVFRTLRNG
jgi:polysaccharide biosynthesis protein PslH